MGDMLIRGIGEELKRRLRDRAQRSKRSMSEEAILLIQRSLSTSPTEAGAPGDRLLSLVQGPRFTPEEIATIESARHAPDREPPNFDSES